MQPTLVGLNPYSEQKHEVFNVHDEKPRKTKRVPQRARVITHFKCVQVVSYGPFVLKFGKNSNKVTSLRCGFVVPFNNVSAYKSHACPLNM